MRPARLEDWATLWPLLVAMGTPAGADEGSAHDRFGAIADDPSWCVAGAAKGGSELLGYAAAQDFGEPLRSGADGRVARLHDLFVDPSARRTGLGAALMQFVVGWASERVRYLQWQAHEHDAAPFYERLGYVGAACPQPEYPEFEIVFG